MLFAYVQRYDQPRPSLPSPSPVIRREIGSRNVGELFTVVSGVRDSSRIRDARAHDDDQDNNINVKFQFRRPKVSVGFL